MDSNIDYPLAFVTGLLGSGHCAGMCGALVSAFFVRLGEDGRRILPLACYHGARIGVYALFGVVAAIVGLALVSTGIIGKTQAILQILAGALVIVLGLDLLGALPARLPAIGLPAGMLAALLARGVRQGPALAAAGGGLVNGLMPCTLTLAMAVKATTAPDPLQGGLLMLTFGLGTLPAMLFLSVAFGRLGAHVRGRLLKAAALVVIVLGVGTLLQGARFFDVMRNLPNW